MSLDQNKTYLTWNGSEFPNSSGAQFKAPAGSSIDWGDGTVESFEAASGTVNTHTYMDGLTEHTIVISGLTSIDWKAFYKCNKLKSIKISDDVTIIGGGAFTYCDSLASIEIPDSVTSIGASAFNSCSKLTSVNIPGSVTSIGNGGFYGCNNLTSVTIGNSVTSIGNSVFGGCASLQSIIIFAETPPTLGLDAIPSNVQSIYVQQSSKAAYQAATNWNTFSSKIVSDNLYLSFIRFNQKNKGYINEKLSEKLEKPETPTEESAVVIGADGSVGTKRLSDFGGAWGLDLPLLKKITLEEGVNYIDLLKKEEGITLKEFSVIVFTAASEADYNGSICLRSNGGAHYWGYTRGILRSSVNTFMIWRTKIYKGIFAVTDYANGSSGLLSDVPTDSFQGLGDATVNQYSAITGIRNKTIDNLQILVISDNVVIPSGSIIYFLGR